MCSKNEIEFSIDAVTGELSVNTTELQDAIADQLVRELGLRVGRPTKDKLIKREFHGAAPAKVKINAGR